MLKSSISVLGGLVLTQWASSSSELETAQIGNGPRFELLVKGGHLVDPAEGISDFRDVAVNDGKIAKISADIPISEARYVVDATGHIVTPGLIDIHVHVYDGVTPIGVPADPNCISKGVTTAIDAGSAGAHTFPGLRQYVVEVADTRIKALLNISVLGMSSASLDCNWGELLDLRYANTDMALRTIERNRDVIVGIKVRLSDNIAGDNDLDALLRAREVAAAAQLPMMVHIGNSVAPIERILQLIAKGDVITHSFRGGAGGILNSHGRIIEEAHEAVARGVHLDIGHGAGGFSFEVAEKALAEGLRPGTISSDLHQYNVYGPVFDLTTTLTKFLYLGMTLEQVIACATANPAALFGRLNGLGTLREGAEADITILTLDEGSFTLIDAAIPGPDRSVLGEGVKRSATQMLRPVATIKGGNLYGAAAIPVVRRR